MCEQLDQLAQDTTHGLLESTKRMTAFTQEYLPLISDYLQVLNAQKDSLTSIYHS